LKHNGTRADGTTVMSQNGKVVFSCFFQQSSLATYSIATERNVVKVPKDVPLEVLAAFPCGVNTGAGAVLNALRPQAGDGFCRIRCRHRGIRRVDGGADRQLQSDHCRGYPSHRLENARSLGATHTIDANKTDPVAEIRRLTDDVGVRASLEAAGSPRRCGRRLTVCNRWAQPALWAAAEKAPRSAST